MPPKKTTQRNSQRSLAKPRTLPSYLIHIIIILTIGLAGWVVWLDYNVQAKFAGARWALPARVYARPLELYAGIKLRRSDLLTELDSLGYQSVPTLTGPGQYQASATSVNFITRGFAFWDGAEPSRVLRASFNNQQLTAISDSQHQTIPLIRVEPQEIAKIYPQHHQDRILVKIREVPKMLIKALVVTEDRSFYQHFGVDPKAIARAVITNIRAGSIRQGGSTLTQQLVKNFFLSHERTAWRKINEAIMALLLEFHYSKDEILEAYLNEIYLGQDNERAIHGFGLAAQFYFGRPLQELAPHHLALLVGLARGASYYDPRRHPDRALQRRNRILATLVSLAALSEADGQRYAKEPLGVTPQPQSLSRFPAFMDLVHRQLVHDYREEDLRSIGLQIFTSLDPSAQFTAEHALSQRLAGLEKQRGLPADTLEGSVVVTAADTGEVLALVGGRNPHYAGFNRVLDAKRPIGSLVKPAIYLTALADPKQYHMLTPLKDMPIRMKIKNGKSWNPANYDGKPHGWVPMYSALAHSYNLATVDLGMQIGIDRIQKMLHTLGVEETLPEYPSILLGSLDLAPLSVAQMYQTFASGGFYTALKTIREVLTADGKPLKRYGLAVEQVVNSGPVFLLNYMLTKVTSMGTARALATNLPSAMPLAGKTGTTNDLRDSWFVGFGSDRLGVVWVGRDDNQPAGFSGANGAMQVWLDMMRERPPAPISLNAPEGVSWYWINTVGKRTDQDCVGVTRFPFINVSSVPEYQACDQSGNILEAPAGGTSNDGVGKPSPQQLQELF